MKHLLYIVLTTVLLTACASSRKATTSSTDSSAQWKDSVRIEYRERTVLVPDTVFIEIPAQTAERTTPDSLSHLENDYAESNARINQDGTLFHDLRTKPQAKPVPTEKEIQYRDSIVYKDRIVKLMVTETKTVEVEKKLSWFQKTQIYGFWALLLLLAIIYRKKLFGAIVRRILKK